MSMLGNLNLQKKAVISFSIVIAVACIILSVLGYNAASNGFGKALEMKAASDSKTVNEILDLKYEGAWEVKNNHLYKGGTPMDGSVSTNIVDGLKELTGNNITIFLGDTRVCTTYVKEDGARAVGTQASEAVVKQVIDEDKVYVGEAEVLGKVYYSVYQPIKDKGGKNIGMFYMGIPTETVEELQFAFIGGITVATLLLMVVMCACAYFAIGKITSQLKTAVDELEAIAEGDLSHEDMVSASQDEIGVLVTQINTMKAKVRALMMQIMESAQQLAASSEELTASATQAADSVQIVADNTVAMAEGSSHQMEVVGMAYDHMNDLNDEMDKVANKADEMTAAATESKADAEAGNIQAQDAIAKINAMAEVIEQSSQKVIALGERSKEISEIVDTISEIADQTNLLSLNAAIEASRAGEHGRGFAVVAEEVRKLSVNTAEAAENISNMIKNVIRDTDEAISSMKTGTATVGDSINTVTAASRALESIAKSIENISGHIGEAVEDVRNAKEKSNNVMDAMADVMNTCEESLNTSQEVSASTEEQTSTMEEIASASRTLAELAQNLQNEVNKFRV